MTNRDEIKQSVDEMLAGWFNGEGHDVDKDDIIELVMKHSALSAAEPVATKLRMIVSHATMGQTDGEGLSTNDICVKITALRNELFTRAQSTAPSVAVKALEWERGTTISRCTTITGAYHATFDMHEWQLSFQGVGKTASFNVSRHPNRSAAENAAQTIHEKALSPYLSAQVQDVAVAEIVSKHGDPEAFGERELVALVDIQKFPYRTKLYAAARAKPAS